MMIAQLIFLITLVSSLQADQIKCEGIKFKEELYQPFLIKEGLMNIRGLTYDSRRNSLFFTFSYFSEKVKSRTAIFNMETNKTNVIHGINNTSTNEVDAKNNVVYIGAIDGLYKLDEDGRIVKTDTKGNIVSISIANDVVYYANSRHEVFIETYNTTEQIEALKSANVLRFAVNNKGDIVFINAMHEVGSLKKGAEEYRIHQIVARTLSKDKDGNIYVCAENGVFEYSITGDSFTMVASLPNLQGMVVTEDNSIIIASSGFLQRLDPKICL